MNGLLEIYYFQTLDLWKRFCEQHNILYDQTIREYSLLLNSDIEGIDQIGILKSGTIDHIKKLDEIRQSLIININQQLNSNIQNAHGLLTFFSQNATEQQKKHLFEFNVFLIDIISALKEQNKKNQIFLNKAISALNEIRRAAMGTKSYSTYNAKGSTLSSAT